MSASFTLTTRERTIILEGTDDKGRPFKLTLPKKWAKEISK